MKKIMFFVVLATTILLVSCDKTPEEPDMKPPTLSTEVNPVNINDAGFDLLENMQGQWVGPNRVIATDYDWFAFDYRAISPSHIFGIFEGGSLGNLFTSFFVTDFKDTRTIMARNGGLLNGIYRTSYFVLDSVSYENNDSFYRLVDAEGGMNTMWMELKFSSDSLYFNAYTSGLGQRIPSQHMTFKAKKGISSLAEKAAADVGFPQNELAWDFSNGFIKEHLQASEGSKSATFLAHDLNKDVYQLAFESGDPWTIKDIPFVSTLKLSIDRNEKIENASLLVNLSQEALTDENGYFTSVDPFDSILLFSEIVAEQDEFTFTYLHPGTYYVTVIADVNGDGTVSEGDITHKPISIEIKAETDEALSISGIEIVN